MKKIIYLITFILITTVIISCKSNPDEQRVYILLKNLKNPFFESIDKGAKSKNKMDYTLITKTAKNESDVANQVQFLNYLNSEIRNNKNENISGIIITPTSSKNELIKHIKVIDSKKIPIVLVDTKIDADILKENDLEHIPYVGSSNFKGGQQAGLLMSQQLPNSSRILLLNGVIGQQTAEDRKRGFIDASSSMNYKIIQRTGNWDYDKAYQITSSLLSNGEKIDGVFAANDNMALGVITAFKNKKIDIPIVIGFDAIDEAKRSIKNNELFATIGQDPFKMGEIAISLIDSLNQGLKIKSQYYPIETKIIQ